MVLARTSGRNGYSPVRPDPIHHSRARCRTLWLSVSQAELSRPIHHTHDQCILWRNERRRQGVGRRNGFYATPQKPLRSSDHRTSFSFRQLRSRNLRSAEVERITLQFMSCVFLQVLFNPIYHIPRTSAISYGFLRSIFVQQYSIFNNK